jgi:hypothetical protein
VSTPGPLQAGTGDASNHLERQRRRLITHPYWRSSKCARTQAAIADRDDIDPAGYRLKAWALLITYQAIRALICHAAAGTDPGRLSFTAALNAARRTLASPTATLASAGSEILASPLPGRSPRTCARALADPTRPYPARNGKPQPLPQAAHYALTITPPGITSRQHHDQQQHVTSRASTPP